MPKPASWALHRRLWWLIGGANAAARVRMRLSRAKLHPAAQALGSAPVSPSVLIGQGQGAGGWILLGEILILSLLDVI